MKCTLIKLKIHKFISARLDIGSFYKHFDKWQKMKEIKKSLLKKTFFIISRKLLIYVYNEYVCMYLSKYYNFN